MESKHIETRLIELVSEIENNGRDSDKYKSAKDKLRRMINKDNKLSITKVVNFKLEEFMQKVDGIERLVQSGGNNPLPAIERFSRLNALLDGKEDSKHIGEKLEFLLGIDKDVTEPIYQARRVADKIHGLNEIGNVIEFNKYIKKDTAERLMKSLEYFYNKTDHLSVSSPTVTQRWFGNRWYESPGSYPFFHFLKNVPAKVDSKKRTNFLDNIFLNITRSSILGNMIHNSIYLPQGFREYNYILMANLGEMVQAFPRYAIHKNKNHNIFNKIVEENLCEDVFENATSFSGYLEAKFKTKSLQKYISVNPEIRELYAG